MPYQIESVTLPDGSPSRRIWTVLMLEQTEHLELRLVPNIKPAATDLQLVEETDSATPFILLRSSRIQARLPG